MGNLIIQIASLAVRETLGRAHTKRRKNIFNINAHIYKGFNKWMKFIYMRLHGGSVYGRNLFIRMGKCFYSLSLNYHEPLWWHSQFSTNFLHLLQPTSSAFKARIHLQAIMDSTSVRPPLLLTFPSSFRCFFALHFHVYIFSDIFSFGAFIFYV